MSNMGDAQDGDFGRKAAEKEERFDQAAARGEEKDLIDDDHESVRPGGKAIPASE